MQNINKYENKVLEKLFNKGISNIYNYLELMGERITDQELLSAMYLVFTDNGKGLDSKYLYVKTLSSGYKFQPEMTLDKKVSNKIYDLIDLKGPEFREKVLEFLKDNICLLANVSIKQFSIKLNLNVEELNDLLDHALKCKNNEVYPFHQVKYLAMGIIKQTGNNDILLHILQEIKNVKNRQFINDFLVFAFSYLTLDEVKKLALVYRDIHDFIDIIIGRYTTMQRKQKGKSE